jgi:citrate synthase
MIKIDVNLDRIDQCEAPMWLTASEALSRLGSKPQSLYASVSRGRIRAKSDPADSRKSLYNAEDVDRLAARSRGRRSAVSVAAEAINWGDPVLPSAISTVSQGRLYYRGRDANVLSRTATLEEVAELLWGEPLNAVRSGAGPADPGPAAALVALAHLTATSPPSLGRSPIVLSDDAARVWHAVADALLGPGEGAMHVRLARRFGRPEAADTLRCALVLLADHELNASTFAARVTVSTGASLAAGALSGLAALNGPLHGVASSAVLALAHDIEAEPAGVEAALRDWLGEGRVVPGFGHRLYPFGDPRAAELLSAFDVPAGYRALLDAADAVIGDYPNVDFALAALTTAYELRADAPLTIFALARTVGWLAHMKEQLTSASIIRPRARYIGVSLEAADADAAQAMPKRHAYPPLRAG